MQKIKFDINQMLSRPNLTVDDLIAIREMDFKHEPGISVVENVHSTELFIAEPKQVFEEIRDGTYEEPISKIRQTSDPGEKRELKKLLPAIIFGGLFNNGRKELQEASNLICLDFDHIEDVRRKMFRLKFSSYIYGMFLSPSGNGLKVIVRTDVEDEEGYKKVAGQLFEHFAKYGLEADRSKQNINDLCFYSYDPDAYYNPKATIWRYYTFDSIGDTSVNFDDIKNSVDHIIHQIEEKELDITSNYNDWRNICFALVDQFGESGRDYFHRVSKFHPEYKIDKCNYQFNACLKSNGSGITIKTFFHLAKLNGIVLTSRSSSFNTDGNINDQEFYTGEELLNRSTESLPVLVHPILPKVGLVALGGTSDVGKSSFLRQLAIAISSGSENFLGFTINSIHKKAIYVSTEDDDMAMGYLLNLQNKELVRPFSSYRNLIFMFDTSNLIQKLDTMLKANPADLVVIDTMYDLYAGEMNQANKIRSYLHNYHQLAKRHQCLVLLLHHTGKRTEDLPPSKNNLLGSQGFEAKMRLVLELRSDRENHELRHLCIVKANYLPSEYKESSYVLRFDSNMLFEDTGVRVAFDDLAGAQRDREAEKQAWIAIAKPLVEEGKTYLEISEILKERGFNVSKSTIQREIPKG
jgi:KaiC/GvpD/RAD55 family RecA-like ATPase